jgi:hypothetical protein
MESQIDLAGINAKIQLMRKTAEELSQVGKNYPAIARNIVRLSAIIKMLEINVSDLVELDS